MMRRLTSVMILTVLLLASAPAFGQGTRGSLSGAVKDPNGAAIAGATVTLKNAGTGEESKATTNSQGAFSFPSVAPGRYSASVEAGGFKKTELTEISIEVSQPASVEISLEVGAVTEQVTVTGTAQEIINTTSPTLSKTITAKQVADLPLLSRNPLDLARLQAGLAVNGTDVRNASVQGLRGNATNVTQDGINAMDNFVKGSSFFALSSPSLNATSEFSITVGTVGSDAGRGVAQVTLITPSGSNGLHGGVFWQHRNDFLNANTFFNNAAGTPANPAGTPRNFLRQNFFGLSASGPVWIPKLYDGRNKSFWFFAYEGFREPFSRTRNRTVLTPEARTGLFRYIDTAGATRSVNLLPLGTPTTPRPNEASFHQLNALTSGILNATPAGNNDTCASADQFNFTCFQWQPAGTDPSDKYNARFDQQLFDSQKWGSHKLEFNLHRGTFLAKPDIVTNSLEAPFPGGVNGFQASVRTLWNFAIHSTFGGRMTNEARVGRQYAPVEFLRDVPFGAPFVNFQSSVTDPDNRFLEQGRNTQLWQGIDNFSLVMGSHTFKMGADVQVVNAVAFNDGGINDVINLGTNSANPNNLLIASFPGISNANFTKAGQIYNDLVGLLGTATRTVNVTSPTSGFVPGATNSREYQYNDVSFFFQDAWRIKRNLTFNYGARYEYAGVPSLPDGLGILATNYNDIFGIGGPGHLFEPNSTAGNASATIDFVSGKTGKGLYNKDWNNLAPFIGFAYSPNFASGPLHWIFGGEGKSSIRAGYSISYLQDGITIITNALGNNPGLSSGAANNLPMGVLTSAGVPIATPTFKIPITSAENFANNFNNGIWTIDPNLRTPYVQQWSFGIEREINSNTAIEIRYAANHAIKIYRAPNFNEVNIFENGFLQEFLNAKANLAARGGTSFAPGAAGTVALPILSALFTAPTGSPAIPASSGFTNSTFISNLQNNNIGTMANTLAFSSTYANSRKSLPPAFFVTNPNAAFAIATGNGSFSKYQSLQIELRRRFSGGLQFQANYTLAHTWNDGLGTINNQSGQTSFRTQRNQRLDYQNSVQDQRHRFVANTVYDLPFGSGRRYLSGLWAPARKAVEGWTAGAIVSYQTSVPFNVLSGRTTFNQLGGNPAQLVGITFDDFKKNLGVFKTPVGVFFINPTLLTITTSTNATTGAVTVSSKLKDGLLGAPAPGTFGNFPLNGLNGPNFSQTDFTLAKRTYFSERGNVELRMIAFNLFNHTNFVLPTAGYTFDDTSGFGKITTTTGIERQISFSLGINW